MSSVLSVPVSDRDEEVALWIKRIVKTLKKQSWLQFGTIVLKLKSSEVKRFREMSLGADATFEIIEDKLLECTQSAVEFFRQHRSKIKSNDVRSAIDRVIAQNDNENQRSFITVPDEMFAEAIWDVINEIPPKDRRGFCSRELGIQQDLFSDCPMNRELMVNMLQWWWSSKVGKNGDIFEITKREAESFLEKHKDARR